MKLRNLLEDLSEYDHRGFLDADVKDISEDSREVIKNGLFVAIKGLNFDGHKFISQAVEKGADVIVCEKFPLKKIKGVTFVKVPDSRRALGLLASGFYKNPSYQMKIIGVTGTDGKTTTASLIHQILSHSGKKCGLVSTVSALIPGLEIETGFHTTSPDAVTVQKLLKKMVDAKCEYAVLEVTSHALSQERFSGVNFDSAILTNITHEHLDYHKTWEEYRDAKLKLFKSALTFVVLNKDDLSFDFISEFIPKGVKIISYSLNQKTANYYAQNITEIDSKTKFEVIEGINSYTITSQLLGEFNVSNILTALSVCRQYGVTYDFIKKALQEYRAPIGRLEKIKTDKDFEIFIDFAHTPNALNNVLSYFQKKLVSKGIGGRLITVFGSAGERDVEKRSLMGEISGKIADISVFTAEDPRSEDVNKIISRMADGAKKSKAKEIKPNRFHVLIHGNKKSEVNKYFVRISERGEAIAFAIQKLAKKGDIVVICGKGHEKSIAYSGIEYPWSDQEAVKIALKGGAKEIKRPKL